MVLINELFVSLQGEGVDIGLPTAFIRMTGCNLRCNWCDTEYAYEEGKEMEIPEILSWMAGTGAPRVCLTGGEPLAQEGVYDLIDALLFQQFDVIVETNGSIDISRLATLPVLISMDIKCPSSGESEKMFIENILLLRTQDQVKFVIADQVDLEFAQQGVESGIPCSVLFQPANSPDSQGLKWLAEEVLGLGLDVRVLPQLHKIIWPDEDRGR